jgi:hypothetical protein
MDANVSVTDFISACEALGLCADPSLAVLVIWCSAKQVRVNLRDARVLIYNFTYRSYELLFLFHMYAHHSNPRLLSERPLKVAFFCFVLDSLVVDDGVAPSLEPYLAFKDFY